MEVINMSIGIEKPLKGLVLDGLMSEPVIQNVFSNFSYEVDNDNLIMTVDLGVAGDMWVEFDFEGFPIGTGLCVGPPEDWQVWELGHGGE
jgi:hypothetical protein